MEKTNKRRAIQIAIAILTGLILWLYVDFQVDTQVTMKVEDVPVVFKYEDTILAERNMMILSGYDTTIDVELRGPRRTLWGMDNEELACVADASSIIVPGQQILGYTVQYESKALSSGIEAKGSVAAVQVTVGELYTKEVPVQYDINGEPAAGFFLGDLESDVKKLVLRAQREDLLNVSYAKVTVNVSGATKTIIQTLDYTLYDYNDVPVENKDIRSATKLVQVTLPIRTTKMVPLQIELVGVPENMPGAVQHKISPAQVELIGEAVTLDTISAILLDKIYVEDLGRSQTLRYDVQPPVGTSLRGDAVTAEVTITVEGTQDKIVPVEQIDLMNIPEGLQAQSQKKLDVTVWGLEGDLADFLPEDIKVSVDLSSVTGAGTYTLPAVVELRERDDVTIKGTYTVAVTVTEGDGGDEPGTTTPETPPANNNNSNNNTGTNTGNTNTGSTNTGTQTNGGATTQ